MKKGWEVKKLGDIISLEYGKPLDKAYRKSDGLYPVYGANGAIDRTDEYYSDEKSIIIGRKGSAGEINYTEKNFWPLDVTYFVKYDKQKLDLDFLFYLLGHLSLPKLAKGVKPGINRNDVYSIAFPIPPFEEQIRIVSILDEAFAAIDQAKENVQRNLKNAKELFQSELNSLKYPKEKLGNIVGIVTGKLNANEAVENGCFPFFTCSREVFRIDKYAFDTEAILLAGNNAVGDFNVKHYKGKFNAYQRTYVITVKDETRVDYRFLYYQMEKSLIGLKSQSVGAGTKFLKLPVIQNFEIDCPPLEVQHKVVKRLDSLSFDSKNLQDLYQQKLNSLEELKKSILQKAFSGELTATKELEYDLERSI